MKIRTRDLDLPRCCYRRHGAIWHVRRGKWTRLGVDLKEALAAYARLTRLALAVTKPGGTLVQCSCSSRVPTDEFVQAVLDAAASAGRDAHVTRRTGHAVDHPIGFEHGEYLKAVYLSV